MKRGEEEGWGRGGRRREEGTDGKKGQEAGAQRKVPRVGLKRV